MVMIAHHRRRTDQSIVFIRWRQCDVQCNKWFLGSASTNGISISSADFTGFMIMVNTQTDAQIMKHQEVHRNRPH